MTETSKPHSERITDWTWQVGTVRSGIDTLTAISHNQPVDDAELHENSLNAYAALDWLAAEHERLEEQLEAAERNVKGFRDEAAMQQERWLEEFDRREELQEQLEALRLALSRHHEINYAAPAWGQKCSICESLTSNPACDCVPDKFSSRACPKCGRKAVAYPASEPKP